MHVHTDAFQRVGATVQRYHILDHEDLGMMSTMQVEG